MTNDNSPSVGWIGLGDQGAPMARAIAEAGYDLHVWARRPAALEALDSVPFTPHDTPAALAAVSDIIGFCLNVDDNVREILTTGAVLAALKPGSVLINHGTGLPAFAREMTEMADSYQVHVLDAPVSGGRAGALAKQLTTIVGGDADVLKTARPVINSFSGRIEHMGEAGTGQLAKLLNNALLMSNQNSLHEILHIARAMDVATGPLIDLLRVSTGSSRLLDLLGQAVTPENAEHLAQMQLVDMDIFSEAVEALGETADSLTSRAVIGARALPELAAWTDLGRDRPALTTSETS